ncbi:MAG: hypothetical protein CM15mP33_09740 [Candidatus Neomarinimicrobiota bacterium]|nr:MAG: hypothetical protein CM15mP33_09740 [Candidatus Neomarinimicrobiota bacterium]
MKEVVKLIKDRSKTITELHLCLKYFYDKLDYDSDLLSKTYNDKSIAIIKDFKSALTQLKIGQGRARKLF